ncbi:hypothetical protein [uncultured Gimesia sp.]|uniref:hypothetical protein n=1 Tax=uncultured Gimesia sp. TaxID=1678688 RepID=UPI0026320CEF|nr:hypothetical protein [uncultured Gimesia sp.]
MTMFLALLLSAVTTEAPQVVNAGFETINERTETPVGWSFTSLPNQAHLVSYKTAVVPSGTKTRALSISVVPNHPDQRVAYNAHQDVQGVVAGKKYRVAARVQARGLQTLPMVVVQCLDESGNKMLAFARTEERKIDNDVEKWENVQTEVTVPEGTSTFRLRIGIPAEGNAGGTALIDDIRIVEIK